MAPTKKTAKKRGLKRKEPIVEDDKPIYDDEQQNIAPALLNVNLWH